MKLGKKRPIRLLATPALGDHLTVPLAHGWPAVKPRGWEYAVDPAKLDMLGNDTVGDCVIAAMMHYAQADTAHTGQPLTPTTQLALETYAAITGYDASQTDASGNNPTDQGASWADALQYWKTHGIPMLDAKGNEALHRITGWAALDLHSIAQQRYACDVFGGTLMGIQCPQSAMGNTDDWQYLPNSPIEGGHGITRLGQGAQGWHICSWGKFISGTWGFSLALADEDYIVVTPQWLNAQGQSPSGLDLNGLLAAMKTL